MQPSNALEVTTLENMVNTNQQITPHQEESTLDQLQNYSPVMITQPSKFTMKAPLVLNDASSTGKVQTQMLNSYQSPKMPKTNLI